MIKETYIPNCQTREVDALVKETFMLDMQRAEDMQPVLRVKNTP